MVATQLGRCETALIFGGDHPLGAAAALALGARGVSVLVVGQDERALAETVGEVVFGGGRARHFVGSSVDAARARAQELFGEQGEPKMIFAPGWPAPTAASEVWILHEASSIEDAHARSRHAEAPPGHVFVAPGGEDPLIFAAALTGPVGVRVLPARSR